MTPCCIIGIFRFLRNKDSTKNAMRRKTLNFRHLPDINETLGKSARAYTIPNLIVTSQRRNVKKN